MLDKDISWGSNLDKIKIHINKYLRAEVLNKRSSFDEMLWQVLSGIVSADGLAFKRAVLFIEKDDVLRGNLGLGPLDKEDEEGQKAKWDAHGKKWVFKEISALKYHSFLKSIKLNNILHQISVTKEEASALYKLFSENQFRKDIWGDDLFDENYTPAVIIDINTILDNQIALFFQRLKKTLNMKLFLMTPLISGDKLVGLLLADNLDAPRDTIEKERLKNLLNEKLLGFSYFANQVATAYEILNLISGWKELITRLTEIHKSLTNQPYKNIKELLSTILTEATKLIEGTGGILFLITRKKFSKRFLRGAVTYNMPDKFERILLEVGKGAAGKAVIEKKTILIFDYPNHPDHAIEMDKPPFKGSIESVVAVPLIIKDNVIGVIEICSNVKRHQFSKRDIELLELFAPIAAYIFDYNRQNVRLRSLFDALPLPFFRADNEGVIKDLNKEAKELLGIESSENLKIKDIFFDGAMEAVRIQSMLNMTKKGKIPITTRIHNQKTNEAIPVSLSASPLVDDLNEQFGSWGIMENLLEKFGEHERYLLKQAILRHLHASQPEKPINSRVELTEYLRMLLEVLNKELLCQWLVFFSSISENETVLEAIAHLGIKDKDKLPHFNWKRSIVAELNKEDIMDSQGEASLIEQWAPSDEWHSIIDKGLRGENRELLENFSLGVPVRLAQGLRGLFLLGPTKEIKSDGNKIINQFEEQDFIRSATGAIGAHALSLLKEINLKEQNEYVKLTSQFVIHRVRTSLMPITGAFDAIRRNYSNLERVKEICKIGEDSSIKLFQQMDNVLKSGISEISIKDMRFEECSLAAFILNCISLFDLRAMELGKGIKIDDSVENLPNAMIDRIQFPVAIGNILDNAIKYSFKGYYIRVSSEIGLKLKTATIIINNIGYEMPYNVRDNFTRPGGRYTTAERDKIIPGTGFGLYEASKIIQYHKGTIDFTSIPLEDNVSFHTSVSITIPIKL